MVSPKAFIPGIYSLSGFLASLLFAGLLFGRFLFAVFFLAVFFLAVFFLVTFALLAFASDFLSLQVLRRLQALTFVSSAEESLASVLASTTSALVSPCGSFCCSIGFCGFRSAFYRFIFLFFGFLFLGFLFFGFLFFGFLFFGFLFRSASAGAFSRPGFNRIRL